MTISRGGVGRGKVEMKQSNKGLKRKAKEINFQTAMVLVFNIQGPGFAWDAEKGSISSLGG